jgi:hypothetical protein
VHRCGHSRPRDRPSFVGCRSEAWLGAFPGAVLPAYEVLPTGIVRPPLRGFVGLVNVASSPCLSSSSDGITSGPFSSPAAFAVAGRRDFMRRLAPSRFEDTRGIFPPTIFWRFAATGPLSAAGLPSFAPAVLPMPVLRVGLIFGAIVGAILQFYLNWLVRGCFLAKSDLPDGFFTSTNLKGGGVYWDHISSRVALPGRPISGILVLR